MRPAPKAAAGCAKDLAKIPAVHVKVGPAIAKKCGAPLLDYDVLRQPAAADLDALAAECALAGVPTITNLGDYTSCLERQHACRVTTLLRVAMPRAVPLIEALDPPFAFPAPCPAP